MVTFGAELNAQTNLTLSTTTAPHAPTEIFSDMVDFDLNTRVAVYRGNVRVNDPQMKLSCELLTATAPAGGGRIESIVAERNVVIEMRDESGQTNHATGDKLVYTFKIVDGVTNEVAVLTGHPRLEQPDFTVTGDALEWDRGNKQLRVSNQQMVFRGTNQPPLLEKTHANP